MAANSTWAFECVFGFHQDTCRKYERDPESRGAHMNFAGCPSCVHRLSANEDTDRAELAWDARWLFEKRERPAGA